MFKSNLSIFKFEYYKVGRFGRTAAVSTFSGMVSYSETDWSRDFIDSLSVRQTDRLLVGYVHYVHVVLPFRLG